MITDHPGDHRTLNKVILDRKEFARDAFNKGTIELVFVPTAEQLADGMTKALPYPTFLAISSHQITMNSSP